MLNSDYRPQKVRPNEGWSVGDFADVNEFKDIYNELIGRNKIFAIMRELKILDKDNIPYQSYKKYFNIGINEFVINGKNRRKKQAFVKPNAEKYLATKINNFIEYFGYVSEGRMKTKNLIDQTIECKNEIQNNESSQSEQTREQALAELRTLAKLNYLLIDNSKRCQELIVKFKINKDEIIS